MLRINVNFGWDLAGMVIFLGRVEMAVGTLPHRPGHPPLVSLRSLAPPYAARRGLWIPAFAGMTKGVAGMTCCVRRTVMAVRLVFVDMLGLASPLASEMLDCRRFSAGHCPRRQSAGPLDGDLHRPESGSFAHPRAVAAAPQRMGPDVCRIHDRLSGPLLGVRFRLAKATDVRWLVLPGRH